ncbi:MAG: UDP-N-acetylmuramoyl-tripeptide--D-alanyl-D-alanine ligase [Mariprofundaceae bacterium]|nr:UDP-N-acetylmuramoyl-tripeptide--D-alanyl-D-alanine ligase [Mariprofundaceae bacterium]
MRLTAAELAQASQGVWRKAAPHSMIQHIGTDTRQFVANSAFLALRGPSFDGHEHAAAVADQACVLIGDALGMQHWQVLDCPQLEVADTLVALGDIATLHRQSLLQTRVIALTGSYGKTTVRDMLAHVLTGLGVNVAATKANLNNLIGVPKTLLDVPSTADVALIECGISEQGEMARLSEIVQPDIAIITGLSHAHAQGLGDLNGVAQEKAQLMTHLLPQGWCLLAEGVADVFQEAGCVMTHPTLNMDDATNVGWSLVGHKLTLKHENQAYTLNLTLPAAHWAANMALVATAVFKLGTEMGKSWSLADMGQLLQTWQAVPGRMSVHPANAEQPFTLIDDGYNANPASMQAALDTLAALPGVRVAVLADMLELGEASSVYHRDLDVADIEHLLLLGEEMAILKDKYPRAVCFSDVEALQTWLQQHADIYQQSSVLCKGSRGMRLDKVVDMMLKRGVYAV